MQCMTQRQATAKGEAPAQHLGGAFTNAKCNAACHCSCSMLVILPCAEPFLHRPLLSLPPLPCATACQTWLFLSWRCLRTMPSPSGALHPSALPSLPPPLPTAPPLCRSMSDLAVPFLVLLEDDALAFWCFASLMRKARRNFAVDESGIFGQLRALSALLQVGGRRSKAGRGGQRLPALFRLGGKARGFTCLRCCRRGLARGMGHSATPPHSCLTLLPAYEI